MEKVQKAFIEYVLDKGQKPASIFQFAKKMKMTEAEFYEQYNSFEQLESEIWLGFFEETKAKLEAEEMYARYSVREKVLAFYYTWFEVLKANRSFVLLNVKEIKAQGPHRTPQLDSFKKVFLFFVEDLLAEGKESKEVKSRKFLDSKYPEALWLKTLWLLDFWTKDTSKGFEHTDTAIEKSVNTVFDLIGVSALDSLLDLAKFVYQNR
ncbi:MAG: TetR family transcriptional regulator C-terminal domain-containing protein [Spirosomataceae bacterium]